MSAEVKQLSLKNANDEPDKFVVEVLEETLALAKAGLLRSVIVAGSITGNRVHTNYSTKDIVESVGLLQLMMHKMIKRMIDDVSSDGEMADVNRVLDEVEREREDAGRIQE